MNKHEIGELHQLQGLSLNEKIDRTKARIKQWVDHWGLEHVYVSFSGGKDSTVLLDIARKMYPDMKAVFLDTSLEFPELRQFVSTFDNVEYLKPTMNFRQVIEKYGYPVISKEVSECVMGARIYLTRLMEEKSLNRTEQNRTEQNIPYRYFYNKVTGQGKYRKKANTPSSSSEELVNMVELEHLNAIRGGYDNKFRKLCGLGLYSKDIGDERIGQRRFSSEVSQVDGDIRQSESDKGEYP
jgi:hypothetical protein